MKNLFKNFSLLLILGIMFVLVGCEDIHEHNFINKQCECGEIHKCIFQNGICECGYIDAKLRIDYFNYKIKKIDYRFCEVFAKMEHNNKTLEEQRLIIKYNGISYRVDSTSKSLNNNDEMILITDSYIDYEDPFPMGELIELDKSYFYYFSVSDKMVEAKIKDSAADNFIGEDVINLEVKIELNNDFEISLIILKFTYPDTNYKLILSVSYEY